MEEEHIKRVEAYFNRSLSESERKKFEADIRNDLELKNVFDEYQLAMAVIDQQVEKNLRTKFSAWRNDQKQRKTRVLVTMMGLAASLLLLVSFYFIFIPKGSDADDQLALEAYTLPKSSGSTMGEGEQHWSAGMEAYNEGDFAHAATEWSAIVKPTPEVTYYLAHSYFKIKKYEQAITLFYTLATGTSVYNYPSDWYLALSYLAAYQRHQFNMQLEKILKDKDHPYYHEAKNLQKRLQ